MGVHESVKGQDEMILREVQISYYKQKFNYKRGQALEYVPQRGGGVTNSGGV